VKFPALPLALTLLVTLLLALPVGPGLAAPDSDDLVRETVDRFGLQTEMPDAGAGPSAQTSAPGSGSRTEMGDSTADAPVDKSTSLAVPDFVRFLLWGIVIVGVPVIVWSLRGSLRVIGRSRQLVVEESASPSLGQSSRMTEARLEADDLARQGRYSDAMHLLLLNSLSEIRRQLGIGFAVSLTSREILRRIQLPDVGRRSLTVIIRSVERTYFGGEDADQDDYSECRVHFENLKQSLATAAA
jgi:hypothetical protein